MCAEAAGGEGLRSCVFGAAAASLPARALRRLPRWHQYSGAPAGVPVPALCSLSPPAKGFYQRSSTSIIVTAQLTRADCLLTMVVAIIALLEQLNSVVIIACKF